MRLFCDEACLDMMLGGMQEKKLHAETVALVVTNYKISGVARHLARRWVKRGFVASVCMSLPVPCSWLL